MVAPIQTPIGRRPPCNRFQTIGNRPCLRHIRPQSAISVRIVINRIVETLERLSDDETLLIQSGKPVGVFRTHSEAPRVLIANSNIVPHWANWEHFNELERKGT